LFGVCRGIWFPEGSILRLLLLCNLVVGEVCGPATTTSSAEFLVRLVLVQRVNGMQILKGTIKIK